MAARHAFARELTGKIVQDVDLEGVSHCADFTTEDTTRLPCVPPVLLW